MSTGGNLAGNAFRLLSCRIGPSNKRCIVVRMPFVNFYAGPGLARRHRTPHAGGDAGVPSRGGDPSPVARPADTDADKGDAVLPGPVRTAGPTLLNALSQAKSVQLRKIFSQNGRFILYLSLIVSPPYRDHPPSFWRARCAGRHPACQASSRSARRRPSAPVVSPSKQAQVEVDKRVRAASP